MSARLPLLVLALAQLVIALDYNIVYVALPAMGTGLGFAEHDLQWVVSAYSWRQGVSCCWVAGQRTCWAGGVRSSSRRRSTRCPRWWEGSP